MTRNQHHWIPSAAEKKSMMDFTKAMVAAQSKGYMAPMKAVEAIDEGLSYDMDKDLEREVALFADCAVSDVAENLIGIFLNTRAAGKLERIEGIEPAGIKKVAMLGGGVMGSGIVNLLLKSGCETILWDINEAALEKGVASVRKTFAFPIKKRKMKQEDLENMLEKQFKTTTDLEDLDGVDLVIEAVVEDMTIKQNIWKAAGGDLPLPHRVCNQHVRPAHNGNGFGSVRSGPNDRASFFQPGPSHDASGDHLRGADIQPNPCHECGLCTADQKDSYRGQRRPWFLCFAAIGWVDGRCRLSHRGRC